MNIRWPIYGIECIVLLIVFTCMIMIPLCRNPIWWIHDYPKDIQEKYFETHERIPTEPLSKVVMLKKGAALLLALGILTFLVVIAGADGFANAFGMSFGLWMLIDWYDCFFLDWVLFANIKRIRLPGTEDMDKAYHQKKYHFVHSIIGMGLGLIPCLLCGVIVMSIPGLHSNTKATFNGSITGDENHFEMDFDVLNTGYSYDLELQSGDSILVCIRREGGRIDVIIRSGEKEPIYQGNDVTDGEFEVGVPESGTYTMEVIGEQAEGYVSFVRKPFQE